MNDEHTPLLSELNDRLMAAEKKLASSEAAQEATLKRYEATDEAYRTVLAEYQAKSNSISFAQLLATVIRLLSLALLLYVSYRVSL